MLYTFGQLKEAVRHAIGGIADGGEATPRVSDGQIVNMAIAHLYSAHQWNWRRKFTLLNIAASVNVITLPSDFSDIIIVAPNSLPGAQVRRVNEAEFVTLAAMAWDGLSLGYMIHSTSQGSPTAEPTFSLGIAPTSPSPISNALSLWYMRTIPSFAATGTADDAKIPDVPQKVHHVLVALCRAYAVSVEDQQEVPEWQLAKQALAEAVIADEKSEGAYDGATIGVGGHTFGSLKSVAAAVLGAEANQHNLGRIVNDAVQMVYTAHNWSWLRFVESITLSGAGPTYPLPIFALSIVSVTDPIGRPVTIVPIETLMEIELNGTYVGDRYFASTNFTPRVNAQSAILRNIRIFPRVSGTVFNVEYRRGANRMVGEADVPEMPATFSPLLARAVRAAADVVRAKPSGDQMVLYKEMLATLIDFDRDSDVAVVPLRPQIPFRRWMGPTQGDRLRVVYP